MTVEPQVATCVAAEGVVRAVGVDVVDDPQVEIPVAIRSTRSLKPWFAGCAYQGRPLLSVSSRSTSLAMSCRRSSNRLATLLPEWGRDLAVLHAPQIRQFLVTVERSRGGDLQSPRIELARPGLRGTVTVDGHLP